MCKVHHACARLFRHNSTRQPIWYQISFGKAVGMIGVAQKRRLEIAHGALRSSFMCVIINSPSWCHDGAMKTCVRQKCQNDSLTKILARKTFFERATQHKSAKLQKALFKTLESYKLKQVTKWYLFLSSVKVMWKLRYVYCPIRSIFSIATILTLWFQTVHRITQALFQ